MSPITSATNPSTLPGWAGEPVCSATPQARQRPLKPEDAEGSPAGGKIGLGDFLHAFKCHSLHSTLRLSNYRSDRRHQMRHASALPNARKVLNRRPFAFGPCLHRAIQLWGD